MITAASKHPDSHKWYYIVWPEEELDGASISSAVWTPDTADVIVEQSQISLNIVGVLLSGGVAGDTVEVVNQITTSSGEVLHETLIIPINITGH